jgi:hypothetical protein
LVAANNFIGNSFVTCGVFAPAETGPLSCKQFQNVLRIVNKDQDMTPDRKSSLRERLEAEAERLAEQAKLLPPGKERDFLRKKVRQMKVAANVTEWIASPGLQPPS